MEILLNVVGNSNCHNSGYYCTDFDVVVVADVVVVVAAAGDVVAVEMVHAVVMGVFFYYAHEDAF